MHRLALLTGYGAVQGGKGNKVVSDCVFSAASRQRGPARAMPVYRVAGFVVIHTIVGRSGVQFATTLISQRDIGYRINFHITYRRCGRYDLVLGYFPTEFGRLRGYIKQVDHRRSVQCEAVCTAENRRALVVAIDGSVRRGENTICAAMYKVL